MTIPTHTTLTDRPAARRRCGEKPTEPKSAAFVLALGFAQFGLFVALLGPVIVSMALKVNTVLTNPTERTSALGLVLGVGAIAAFLGNALFGRLSDRTTSRFGRRRPWLIGGSLVMAAALLLISQAQSVPVLAVGWFIAQLGANAAFAPFIATMADQLPDKQYAKASAMVGVMQNVGVLGASQIASHMTGNMLGLFMVPAAVGVAGMVIYALVLDDPVLEEKPARLDWRTFAGTFWTNPFRNPDFGFAWWSRFLIILSSFLFTTFRLNFLVDRVGLRTPRPPARSPPASSSTPACSSSPAGSRASSPTERASARCSSPPPPSSSASASPSWRTRTPSPPSTSSRRSWAWPTAST